MSSDLRWHRVFVTVGIVTLLILGGLAVQAAFLDNTAPVQDGVTLHAPDGPAVNITETADVNLTDAFETHRVRINSSVGNVTVISDPRTNLTITQINGTYTNVTAIETNGTEIEIDPDDKDAVNVSGGLTALDFRQSMTVDDGAVDFSFDATSAATINLTQSATSTQVAAIGESDTVLRIADADANGNISFGSLTTTSKNDVVLQTNSGGPSQSNPSPTGEVTDSPDSLSIDVSDPDAPQDELTVTFSVDGSQIDSTTVKTNQTVTTNAVPTVGPGEHTWTVNVTDAYGASDEQSYTFETPDNLTIREESEPHDTIDSATVSVRFFEQTVDDPDIVNRSTTNGVVNLTGLPANNKFVAVASAPGYHNRSVLIDTLYDQQSMFLINRNRTVVENRFTVDDRTGNFAAGESELVIEKAINRSLYGGTPDNFTFTAVAGDTLGADRAYTTDLIEEDRYRIRVRSDDNTSRILGAYTAETAGTINLEIGSVAINPEEPNTVAWSANRTGSSGNMQIVFEYNDTRNDTDTLYVEIYEFGNESNVLLANTSIAGPLGTTSVTQQLSSSEENTTWVVDWVADRGDKPNLGAESVVGPTQPLLGALPGWMRAVISLGVLFMLAGVFSQLNGEVGAIVVAGVGALLWYFNLTPESTGGGVVILALVLAGVVFYVDRGAATA